MSAPFMQLYVADYLGDTRHLTTEQHGAYLLLLMTMWRSDGRLPNDPKKLARITGCSPSRWARIGPEVLAYFEAEGDVLTNRRLTLELKKAHEKSNQRAVSGSLGGKAKSLKTRKTSVANATVLPKHSSEPEPDTVLSVVSSNEDPTGVPPPDPNRKAWSDAEMVLVGLGGMSARDAKTFFGGLLKAHGLEPRDMLGAIGEAFDKQTPEPRAYLKAAAVARARRHTGPAKRVGWV